jgi:methionine biosynthesis protein MetW
MCTLKLPWHCLNKGAPMSRMREFYRANYRQKARGVEGVKRDLFHRAFVDLVFDPYANNRKEIALQLIEPTRRLLDIGCRDGAFLGMVLDVGLCSEVCGVDISEEAIGNASDRGFQASVVDLNDIQLPYPDSHFGAVTVLGVVEHLFDPDFVLSEISRVLEPSGQLVVAVPNVASFSNRVRILCGRVPVTSRDPGWDGGHLHYFTKHSLDEFLKNHGFSVRRRLVTGGGAWLRNLWPSLLGGELVYLAEREPQLSPKRNIP